MKDECHTAMLIITRRMDTIFLLQQLWGMLSFSLMVVSFIFQSEFIFIAALVPFGLSLYAIFVGNSLERKAKLILRECFDDSEVSLQRQKINSQGVTLLSSRALPSAEEIVGDGSDGCCCCSNTNSQPSAGQCYKPYRSYSQPARQRVVIHHTHYPMRRKSKG